VEACEHVAYIPIASDSLNAAQAATVALYEMTRGWRGRPTQPFGLTQPPRGCVLTPTDPGRVGAAAPVKVPAS
jgi:hypothetical protein